MKNYLLTLSYDGTDFHGWQRQTGQRTVQETVENAMLELTNAHISVTASGRTDEGVHALGQAVSFACDTNIPTVKFADALNTKLPSDVRVVACREVGEDFCARRSAKRKTYVYRFYLSRKPLVHMERYALRVSKPFDCERMQKACRAIEGKHDFRAFYCLGSSAKTTVRTVYSCKFTEYPACGITPVVYELEICGDGFLYKMVRLIAGALHRYNDGKIDEKDLLAAIEGKSDAITKVPAESKGLCLVSVEYDNIQ